MVYLASNFSVFQQVGESSHLIGVSQPVQNKPDDALLLRVVTGYLVDEHQNRFLNEDYQEIPIKF